MKSHGPKALCRFESTLLVLLLSVAVSCGVALASPQNAEARPEEALVAKASAPVGTDARIKLALRKAISAHVDDLGLVRKLRDYTIVPALVHLHVVVEPKEQSSGLTCVVELSLQDAARGVVANVRGSAVSVGATRAETVDAAARAAVSRLSETLLALKKQDERRD